MVELLENHGTTLSQWRSLNKTTLRLILRSLFHYNSINKQFTTSLLFSSCSTGTIRIDVSEKAFAAAFGSPRKTAQASSSARTEALDDRSRTTTTCISRSVRALNNTRLLCRSQYLNVISLSSRATCPGGICVSIASRLAMKSAERSYRKESQSTPISQRQDRRSISA
jgi:hypothetical protein